MKKLLPLLLLLSLSACDDTNQGEKRAKAVQNVNIASVSRSPLSTRRIVSGSLEAITTVRIFNQEEGRLLSLPYFEGDAVKKGELVAEIDASIIQAELDKTKATLNQAKTDLKRITSLHRKKLASEDELARAKTALELAESEESLLKTRYAHTRIRAPFDGIISERRNEPGDVVPVHSHILSIIDQRQLKIVVHLSELLLANIKVGDVVQVRIDALGEALFPAKVIRIHPVINPRSRQGTMEVQLDSIPSGAKPGQLSRVYITSQTTPRRSIPFNAIRHDSKGEYVYRVKENSTLEQVHVETGIQFGNDIEVLSGLDESDNVVIKGFIGLSHGAKVNIVAENKKINAQVTPADENNKLPRKGNLH